ncbi:hypothetical protein R1flu_000760 [Riccia fluitans]|uniref:NB-ARC domain-containing protein n=1 Tax=Riccia fluitans TaxID=41844 RepID=A0ABD1Y1S5_9MARC
MASSSNSAASMTGGNFLQKVGSRGKSAERQEEGSGATVINGVKCTKITDSVYELYRPKTGKPEMEFVFFHGLRLRNYHNACVDTWMSSSDPSECWIQTWLPQKFPLSRVLTVSYDSCASEGSSYGRFDLYRTAEMLARDLLDHAKVGQEYGTPVVLMGHCLGGLVIKELCYYIDSNLKDEVRNMFLANMAGAFFIATPQVGMHLKPIDNPSPFVKILENFEETTARLNQNIQQIQGACNWDLQGVGESQPTPSSDLFPEESLAVEEGSARPNLRKFSIIPSVDHSSICKPSDINSTICCRVFDFLEDTLNKARLKYSPEFPMELELPEKLVGLDEHLRALEDKVRVTSLINIWGMGGIGKSTLAKAFLKRQDMSSAFDYVAYVERSNYKEHKDFSLKSVISSHYLYRKGRRSPIHGGDLQSKTCLFILDDVQRDDLMGETGNPLRFWSIESRKPREKQTLNVHGSRVLVTSRDRDVLRGMYGTTDIYDMTPLKQEESYDLLVNHAFSQTDGDGIPNAAVPAALSTYSDPDTPSGSENLVADVARLCEGLPLALEVIGIFLRDCTDPQDSWRNVRRSLREADLIQEIDERLWKKLKVSYDSLADHVKEMFLDAATIFNGLSLNHAHAAWNTWTDGRYRDAWKTLINRSLVYRPSAAEDEEGNGIIKMHEQLRSLGRYISATLTPNEILHFRQRIWTSKKAWELISAESRNTFPGEEAQLKAISGLRFHFSELSIEQRSLLKRDLLATGPGNTRTPAVSPDGKVVQISASFFRKMPELRYLILDGVDIAVEGNQQQPTAGEDKRQEGVFSSKLIMLNWSSGCTWFDLSALFKKEPGELCKLTLLHLKCVQLQSLDHLMDEKFTSLKIVELLSANKLDKIPQKLHVLRTLEILAFFWCRQLKQVPNSLGKLERLKHLVFWDCQNLQALPELTKLKKLKRLILTGCSSLLRLPGSVGTLHSLEIIDLHRCLNLEELPQSISDLTKLRSLRISGKFDHLPDGFGARFLSMKHLQFKYCEYLKSIPSEALATCSNLQQLTVLRCKKLKIMPGAQTFEGLQRLKIVRVGWVAIDGSQIVDHQKVWYSKGVNFNVRGYTGPGLAHSDSRDEDAELDTISDEDVYWSPGDECEDALQPTVHSENSSLWSWWEKFRCHSVDPKPDSFTSTGKLIKGEYLHHRYLTLKSVHRRLRQIHITIESHDQGYSSYFHGFKGTELAVHSFGDLVIRSPGGVEISRTNTFWNLHAISEWQTHRCTVEDKEYLAMVKRGYVVEVWVRSEYLAWETYVRHGSLELIGDEDDSEERDDRQAVVASYECQQFPTRELKKEYLRIPCRWQSVEKVYVEFDSNLRITDGMKEGCFNSCWGPVWSDGDSNWNCTRTRYRAEIGVIDANGNEAGKRIHLYTNMFCGGFGRQRHTYMIEDGTFLSGIKEGCSLVLWIRHEDDPDCDPNVPDCRALHVAIRHAQIHLIPKVDIPLSRYLKFVFPNVDKLETKQGLQRGKCCDYMYLAYQSPFETLREINVVVQAREYPLASYAINPEAISRLKEFLSELSSEELSLVISTVKMNSRELNQQLGILSTQKRKMVEDLGSYLSWGELYLLIRTCAKLQEDDRDAEKLQHIYEAGKGSTWGELGVINAGGVEIGQRVVLFTNTPHHLSTSWKTHKITINERHHKRFLSSIPKGYRVALWLRSGPGWSEQLGTENDPVASASVEKATAADAPATATTTTCYSEEARSKQVRRRLVGDWNFAQEKSSCLQQRDQFNPYQSSSKVLTSSQLNPVHLKKVETEVVGKFATVKGNRVQ